MLKEQHIMPRSKEIQEQMRNKIVDMYQSGSKSVNFIYIAYLNIAKLSKVLNNVTKLNEKRKTEKKQTRHPIKLHKFEIKMLRKKYMFSILI